jgi:hypothetical protein
MIDASNDLEVYHWARDMQVEPYELRAAVAVAGPRLSDLRRYFGKSAHIIFLGNRLSDRQAKRATWSAFPPVA